MSNRDEIRESSSREVRLLGAINSTRIEEKLRDIFSLYREDPKKPIRLLLNSSGGDLDAALAFYEIVTHRKIPLEVDAFVSADSAAIAILCTGLKRRASRSSTFLFHTIKKLGGNEALGRREHLFYAREIGHTTTVYAEIIARVTKKKPRQVRSFMSQEVALSAEQAKRFGLIHKIIDI